MAAPATEDVPVRMQQCPQTEQHSNASGVLDRIGNLFMMTAQKLEDRGVAAVFG